MILSRFNLKKIYEIIEFLEVEHKCICFISPDNSEFCVTVEFPFTNKKLSLISDIVLDAFYYELGDYFLGYVMELDENEELCKFRIRIGK